MKAGQCPAQSLAHSRLLIVPLNNKCQLRTPVVLNVRAQRGTKLGLWSKGVKVQVGAQMPRQAMTLWDGQCWDRAGEETRDDNPQEGPKAKDMYGD